MLELFSLQREAFGLDISDLSLKICRFKRSNNITRLVSFAEFPVAPGLIEQGEIKEEDELAQTIKEALKTVKGKSLDTKHVVASLPEEKAFLQVLQLPKMRREDVAQALRFEAENYIPFPLDTVYLDFQIIEPFRNHLDHFDILLAALPKTTVDSYVAVLEKAGLAPKALEIEPLALGRALIENEITPFPVMILDLGGQRTGLSIFAGSSLHFAVSIPISSRGFTKTVADALHIDAVKAEQLKKEEGIEYGGNSSQAKVSDALMPVLTELIGEVKKYAAYYETHGSHEHAEGRVGNIKRVVLCGGGANLRGLPELLTKELRIGVVSGNPWINILRQPLQEIPPIAFRDSLQYATAIGLALRGIAGKGYD